MTDEEQSLKRDIGWYGSFSMGYADVGANVFIALGLVALYAGGATPIAFLVASMTYVATGLAYAELATTYPYAGGAQVYSMKAFNDLGGFVAGWAVMLDYTVDIALFSLAAAGYLSYFLPRNIVDPSNLRTLGILAVGLVLLLLLLNVTGIRGSSKFNEILVAVGISVQSIVLVVSLALHFDWNLFLSQLLTLGVNQPRPGIDYLLPVHLTFQNFIYAATLAMASFIGIESIAQAAEETKKPYRWIPRANKLSIIFVLIFTIGLSIAGTGGIGAEGLVQNIHNPVTAMAQTIPSIGFLLAPVVAFTGFALCYVSTNTGVIGVSRVVFSMGRYRLLPQWFYKVHKTFRTPVRAILIFGVVGAALSLTGNLELVADLYNFGALLSYIMVNLSLIILRNAEPDTYRAWKVPGEINLRLGQRRIIIPAISVIGTISCTSIWLLIVIFHPAGRLLGASWLLVGLAGFLVYRKLHSLPIMSKEGGRQIKPSGYVMNALALVRTPEDPDAVAQALSRALDPRFNLTLFNVIDPALATPRPGEFGHYDYLKKLEDAEKSDLEDIAKRLRDAGFKCQARVAVGPLSEVLRQEAESEANDVIVLIKRKAAKGDVEKERIDSAYAALSRYPGKLMVVRRVEVRGRRR
ncbi:MAG TPA: amino acid permease [Candidatus Bathyarchaeia archaeon]